MSREKLVEDVAKAIFEEGNLVDATQWSQSTYQEAYRRRARAALAVFEKAHAPTDNEPSDAQVEAAYQAWRKASVRDAVGHSSPAQMERSWLRAALRAAAEAGGAR